LSYRDIAFITIPSEVMNFLSLNIKQCKLLGTKTSDANFPNRCSIHSWRSRRRRWCFRVWWDGIGWRIWRVGIGTVPVVGAGAVAGAAAYGAINAIAQGDAAAFGKMRIGAIGGAGVSNVR
jgi:hypothetical protein